MSVAVFAADGAPEGMAPAREFERVAEAFAKEAPSQDLVDRLYTFMEKYPKDARSDRVQYWVGITQQRRKFHNEAIKEFGFVISDFPSSPLVVVALCAQIDSYAAIGKGERAGEIYTKLASMRPTDLTDLQAAAAYRDGLLHVAGQHLAKKEVDQAIALYLQLPSRQEALARVVELYIASDRHDDAMNMVRRLPPEEKPLAFRLTLTAYSARPAPTGSFRCWMRSLPRSRRARRPTI